jgi:3-hydroxyisobutyrate dehydrogenase-like beta-hydroxyacid dehydrogenase
MDTVGFIGLGKMGGPVAGLIQRAASSCVRITVYFII